MLNSLDEINELMILDYAVKTLSDVMSEMDVSTENVSELENVVNLLEMHEAEVRRLRQSLSLRFNRLAFTIRRDKAHVSNW